MSLLDIRDILEHLPHRYPFLLVDRVLELEKGKRIVAIKNVTINEPFFPGHFPHYPVMPGVLILEALAQGRGVLLVSAHLGSFDALRVLAQQRPEVGIRILLDAEQNPGISTLLNGLNPALAQTVLNARQAGPALALAMKEALDANCIVATLGDRLRPGNSAITVDFLGAKAEIPAAPWQMAGVLKVPLIVAFGLFRGGKRYEMYFERVPVPQQFALAKANEAFDEAGALKDPKHQAALEAVVGALVRVAAALKSPS